MMVLLLVFICLAIGIIIGMVISNRKKEKQDDKNQPQTKEQSSIKKQKTDNKKITVVGIGGSGNNTLNDLVDLEVDYVKLVGIETAENEIKFNLVDNSLLIGKEVCKGKGTGSNPKIGKLSFEENKEQIEEVLKGTKTLILTAGFGGGTGTGVTPEIAKLAKKMQIPTIAYIIEPFDFEGKIRKENFASGVELLRENVDYLIKVSNDKLYEIEDKNISIQNAFKIINNRFKDLIDEIYEGGINKGKGFKVF